MVLVEIVAGLDPPRVIGYQLPGRGRRELRADRILRIEPIETVESAELARPDTAEDPKVEP